MPPQATKTFLLGYHLQKHDYAQEGSAVRSTLEHPLIMQRAVRSHPDGVFVYAIHRVWTLCEGYDRLASMTVRMRHTSSHTKNRRSHHALKNRVIVKNDDGTSRLPHRIDEATGMYRGHQIVSKKDVKAKKKDHDERVAEHAHDHTDGDKMPVLAKEDNTPKKGGMLGRMMKDRARSRSGMGGGV